jgi:hypothetical protein
MNATDKIKKRILMQLRRMVSPPERDRLLERQLLLQCLLLAKSNRKLENIDVLADSEFSGFSQWGEDGIIDWLVEKLPGIPQIFVEFGVEDYRESNTRLLLQLRNWSGLVMDGSQENITSILQERIYWQYDLMARCEFIDCDNVNNLLAMAGVSGDIGLLSIDIDGNDYWVWQSINIVNPAIVVCEYNAVFGDLKRITVPYKADFMRNQGHYSNLYFGASLPALTNLANHKGYTLIGTNSNGNDAFFVRKDLANPLLNYIGEVRVYPSKFRESRNETGKLTFKCGESRLEAISHLPVFDIDTNQTRLLSELGELYSTKWKRNS